MPRYELSEGTSNKFWEIELDGASFTTRYGRIGSDGQTTTKEFKSVGEAKKAYEKLIEEKVKKGYSLAGGEEDDGDDGDVAAGATDPDLETAIFKDPDNVQSYLVYGDWLQMQGDPRGELIAVHAALLEKPGDEALRKRAAKILGEHRGEWLGDLAHEDEFKEQWHLGFLRSATIGGEEEYGEIDSPDVYAKLARLPSARFLRELVFGVPNTDDGTIQYQPIVDALVANPPKALRSLTLSAMGYQISWTELGDLSPLYAKIPGLRSLTIKLGVMGLGTIRLPELREFEVVTGGFTRGNMKSVASAAWPKLEKLVVYFGSDNYGADCTIDDVRPILDGKGIPNVTSLGLCNAEFADDIAAAVAESKMLKQVKALDLSQGTMTDAGAQAIAYHAKAFAHLESLDLSQNYISSAMAAKLAKVCKHVDVGQQGEPDEDYRFVQVAE
jgi:uncharacterized protein (TIGR02996 family)